MISRFNQLLLAFTTVTPLLLSIAIVLILLYSSGYINAWSDLFQHEAIPNSSYWWVSNIFVLIFVASWIWTKHFLNGLMKRKRGVKSITLSSLQNKPLNNLLPVVAMYHVDNERRMVDSGNGNEHYSGLGFSICHFKTRLYKLDMSFVWL